MPAKVTKLGPGTLKVGATGTEVDFTCQVTAAHVDWTVDEGDDTVVLCGETVPGERTYSSVLAGTLYQDLSTGGIVEYSWVHRGETQPFTFEPNDEWAASVAGNLILDPLTVGGDTAGENMTSDFEWKIVGDPTFTAGTAPAAAEAVGAPATASRTSATSTSTSGAAAA